MPVNQTIQNFYRSAADKDFSRDFLFRVTQMQLQGVPALTEGDLIYVKTAALPGRDKAHFVTTSRQPHVLSLMIRHLLVSMVLLMMISSFN